MQFQYLEMSK